MHEDLTKRIVQYLELETSYAIIINGDYGIGKTHYIKNQLFPRVKETDIPHSSKGEKFNPILISLFGVNSIHDIQDQIFSELYPILKKKGVKIAMGLGKSLFKFLSGSELKELLNDTDISSEDGIGYSKILLCIDDIDRKSKDLNLEEVFGFINNLAENFSAKIILVANEDELRNEINAENQKDVYSTLREKVIGVTVNFESDVTLIYDQIIEDKYKEVNNEYFNFLTQQKKIIVERIQLNKDNLRNLLFFFEEFKIIFNELSKFLNTENKFEDYRQDILNSVLDFTLPIAIEYKLGKLSPSNLEDIKGIYKGTPFDFKMFLGKPNQTQEETKKTYSEEYQEKYIRDIQKRRSYFDSIFKYITGSGSFQIEELAEELNSIYKITNNEIPERERILMKLNYWDCINLSSTEYSSLTRNLLSYVDQGNFSLEEYPVIFRYCTRFNNILKFDINKLKTRFIKGINKGKKNYTYTRNLSFKMSFDQSDPFNEDLKEIANYCDQVNNKLKIALEEKRLRDVFELLSTDFESFIDKVNDRDYGLQSIPFFTTFDFTKFWRIFIKLDNSQIIELSRCLEYRYHTNIYQELHPEKEFLLTFKHKIAEARNGKNTNMLKRVAFDFITEKIDQAIMNFPSTVI